jgi:hypothetical protein
MLYIKKLARPFMLLLAVMNLGFMIWVLFYPFKTAAFVGLSALNENAEIELRTMYGGLIGGLGIINLLGALKPKRTENAVWATAWSFLGVGIVRSCGCLFFNADVWQIIFAISEMIAAATCFIMLKSLSVVSVTELK